MDEYQISDLIASNVSVLFLNDSGVVTLIFAYLAVAYVVGQKLARVQVAFLNTVFVGINISAFLSAYAFMSRNIALGEQLAVLNAAGVSTVTYDSTILTVYMLFRVFMVVGCLVFMWQLRRGDKRI